MSEYLPKLAKAFPEKDRAALELMCASRWDIQKVTGQSRHFHRLAAMRLMFPHRTEHAWREKMVYSWHDARETLGLQEIGWMGSAMSNKTGTMADTLLTLFWEDPGNTTIYVASPTKDATARRLWAELQRSFKIATEKWPKLPGTLRKGEITYGADDLRAGIFMVSADDHGTLIGANNPNVAAGKLIVATDELPNIPGQAAELLEAIENLKMRRSFVFLYAGNFAEVDDGMGRAGMPAEGGYECLDPDVDMEWLTSRGGKVYRFDGMQSPNVLAKRDIYPFLTRWERVKLYLDRGETDTAEFMRWIRSFPVLGLEAKTVTNRVKIEANLADTDATWGQEKLKKGLAVDPGFGGDPCVMQPLILGRQKNAKSLTLDFPTAPITIPIRVAKKVGQEKQAEAERQIVAYVKDYCERENIDPENVIFDASMRAGIVQAFNGWSSRVIAVDFGGSASGRMRDALTKKTWHDEASNFVTELWMAFGDAIMSGQIRGLQRAAKAARQFCARRWKWAGKKKQIIPKDEFKKMNEGQSPNEGDSCVLGLEWARRNGLTISGNLANHRLTAEMISELLGAANLPVLPNARRLDIGERAPVPSRLER